MLYQNLCPTCGAELQKVSETKYVCEFCKNVYSAKKIENYADKLSKLFDEAKLELVSNAKKNLFKKISVEDISKNEVIKWCDEVKKYIPDDFQANFYYALSKVSKREVAKMIRDIDVDEYYEILEILITVLIKSLEKWYVTATKDLIERAYKLNDRDIEKYIKYTTLIENEAEKLDKGVYDIKQHRKAFVAYSSKDADKAIELVEELENQGISCFISLRNLRHGVGSQENYDKFLKEAMDNCMSFVFVSSMNSRNTECDAYEIEMDYVMKTDIKNAPIQLRSYYKEISKEIKKPRVEYRIQESIGENYADDLVDEFFDGYERAYTIKDVAQRLLRQSRRMEISASDLISAPIGEKRVKFCIECITECNFDAKFCQNCGKNEFADTKKEAELTKKLNDIETNNITPIVEKVIPNKPLDNVVKEHNEFNLFRGENNKKNKKRGSIKGVNYFLYDYTKKKNVSINKLTFDIVNYKTGRYLSMFAASEGKIWNERVLDSAEINSEFKPLVAYKLLYSLADKDVAAGWKCLENASSKTIVFICEALNANSDFEFSNAFGKIMSEKPLNIPMIRDYLVRNKKYIQNKMLNYVIENIELF